MSKKPKPFDDEDHGDHGDDEFDGLYLVFLVPKLHPPMMMSTMVVVLLRRRRCLDPRNDFKRSLEDGTKKI
jgi:hypothetical protein